MEMLEVVGPVGADGLFVNIPDDLRVKEPFTNQNSGASEVTDFNELLSNYTNEFLNSLYPACPKSFASTHTSKFPAFKWECSLPENIVVDQKHGYSNSSSIGGNRSISQQSPVYSLFNQWSSDSSSLHSNKVVYSNDSIAEDVPDGLDPNECLKLAEVFYELRQSSCLNLAGLPPEPSKNVAPKQEEQSLLFDYTSLGGTIVKLKLRDLVDAFNPNPVFCQMKTQPVHALLRVREQVIAELGNLLNESIEKDKIGIWQRSEHKFSKRLSDSIRRARRLSSYKREVFGRSLASIRSQRDQTSPFPLFIHQILTILLYEAEQHSTEGLLRTAASKSKLDASYKLCSTLDVDDFLPAELSTALNIYILADLLKRFLREVPERLLPQNIWRLMVKCSKLEGAERLLGFQYCVLLLNPSQREALFTIGSFLLEISRFKHNTLMDIKSLTTVIMPNIIQMESIPLDQSIKFKGLMSSTLAFVFENIYAIMSMPDKMMMSLGNAVFQIALDSFALNINYCYFQNSYWKNEHVRMGGIVVKSRIYYDGHDKRPIEFRGEMELQANGSEVFASLIDSDHRSWDPTLASARCDSIGFDSTGFSNNQYNRRGCCNGDANIFGCKPNQPMRFKRYSGRLYDEKLQVYVLFEKAIQQNEEEASFNRIFFIQPIDVYTSRIVFLLCPVDNNSKTEEDLLKFGPRETGQILDGFRAYLMKEQRPQ